MRPFRSIVSAFLALLVLLSSTSFMVGVHFCMGKVKHVAVFHEADVCEMESRTPPCHKHPKTSCCDDASIVHEGVDFSSASMEISIPSPDFTAISLPLVPVSEIIPVSHRSGVRNFHSDSPPLWAEDLTVSLRTFRI